MAQSRCINLQTRIGALVQDSNMLIPYAGQLSSDGETFVDAAVIVAGRTLPTWSDRDMPPIPSAERKAVKELKEECLQMLAEFPTTSEQD
ncbi:Protein PLASTID TRANSCRIPTIONALLY ACTIVE 14 [Camellia lanceoleosa]|uniref:Protein PLASTID TRANSCRIPTIONALLY ACTIVE 14 n=1 Tax=Camellia lanceoleosa TaxID=1840588 RepID=A0ACC0I4C9_9ERIC|nr:Protein PLASTID TRANSCRIPTIONALLY ACTIVE 14 [Camellia lanceoleosa]